MMLEHLHRESFAELLDEPFRVVPRDSPAFDLRLKNVSEHLRSARQEAFSVIFHGPPSPFIQQGIYQLHNEKLGDIELFLVPIGRDSDGFQYEAVFNRLIPAK